MGVLLFSFLCVLVTAIIIVFLFPKKKKTIVKVIFDSNVYRKIGTPETFKKEPSIKHYKKIRKAIKNGEIEPYISETVFTIEAVQKKNRKQFLSLENLTERSEIISESQIKHEIDTGAVVSFENNPILKKHFLDILKIKFKIVRFPRIGGIINSDLENFRHKMEGNALSEFHTKVFEVGKKIEDAGAGISQLKKIGFKYDTSWQKGIKEAPDSEQGEIGKACAEWADGDSVSICIALGCDYLCTNDNAVGGGSKSVFSATNLAWLSNQYQLKIISPEDLANLL